MASKKSAHTPSPSSSSTFLPLGLSRSRRGSISSISSRSHVDKEALSQALDYVHSSASRTDSLTSFNDFAAPPSSASPPDDRGLAGQFVSGSFGGIYSRLKQSVGASKDPTNPSYHPQGAGGVKGPSHNKHRPATPSSLAYGSPGPTIATSSSSTHSPKSLSPKITTQADQDHAKTRSDSSLPFAANAKLIAEKDIPESGLRETPQLRPTDTANAADPLDSNGTFSISNVPNAELESLLDTPVDADEGTEGTGATLKTVASTRNTSDPKLDTTSKGSHVSHKSTGTKTDGPNHQAQSQLPGLKLSRTASSNPSRSSLQLVPSTTLSQSDASVGDLKSSSNDKRADYRQPSTAIVNQVKRKVLSRDFWMKDENAKVCFNCGEAFTTFRRKHHCRLCGQIYCATCTNLISGKPFGQASKLRVCKTCEVMINGDDSSDPDYSDEEDFKQTRFSETPQEIAPSHNGDFSPINRTLGDGLLSSANSIRPPALARPSSSRSLKSLSGRPRSSSQRPRRSRHQHMRSLGVLDGGAPFHKGSSTQATGDHSLPAFHTDSIIDPDLAPFMSDEGSSDEEQQPNIATTMNSDLQDPPATPPNGPALLMKRGRPKSSSRGAIDTSGISRDGDNSAISSFKTGQLRRQGIIRTWSLGNVNRYTSSPRVVRSENLFTDYNSYDTGDKVDSPVLLSEKLGSSSTQSKDIPIAELNQASLAYVKKLLRQFLDDYKIDNATKWENTLVPILLRCAEEVDPNIHRGDDIDIRHYVKLKKAVGGSPKDSTYISGVVFTKNIALKDMPRNINNPRILLLSFPLVYGKQQATLMSIDPVMAQEGEYLRNVVKRIVALNPNVVLVQREVSGLALQFLHDAGVTVVKMVKPSVMQAVARCAQTRIVTSVEKLTLDAKILGACKTFAVKTYAHGGVKKTHIYLAGCQQDLGCTIVLRGADQDVLARLKWVTEFMCYVVYNLKLETSLMRDEFVSIPSTLGESNGEDTPGKSESTAQHNIATPSAEDPTLTEKTASGIAKAVEDAKSSLDSNQKLHGAPRMSHFSKNAPLTYNKMVQDLERRALSISPLVKLADPFLLLRGREQEKQMNQLLQLQKQDDSNDQNDEKQNLDGVTPKFELVKPDMVYGDAHNASPQIREALRAIHSAEYDKVFHRYTTLRRRWETYIAGVVDPFSPLTHQRIVVLFSIVSTQSADSCEGPDLLGLDFYQERDIDQTLEPDVPLGEYVERLCEQADSPCIAQRCEKKMIDHHRQYVHGEGQLSIFTEKMKSKIRGLENTILMWSCCRICDHETQVVPMSGNSWKYSFGKYLELSFWSDALHARAGTCTHDIQRDHVRYFGFRNFAIRVQYDPINILEVIVPRLRILWKVEKDLVLKNEQYQNMEERITRFFTSVKVRIKSIKLSNVIPDKQEACKAEVDSLSKRANEEYDFVLKKLQEKYMTSKYYEIIPLNRAIRALQEKVADWDNTFLDFEKEYLPSEKDLRKLATAQLKEAYFDRNDSLSSIDFAEDQLDEKKGDSSHRLLIDEKSSQRSSGANTPAANSRSQSPSGAAKEMASLPVVPNLGLQHEMKTIQRLDLALPSDSTASPSPSPGDVVIGTNADHSFASPNAPKDIKSMSSPPGGLAPLNSKPTEQAVTAELSANNAFQDSRKLPIPSAIPKLTTYRQSPGPVSPPLLRSKTQPAGVGLPMSTLASHTEQGSSTEPLSSTAGPGNDSQSIPPEPFPVVSNADKKLPERTAVAALKSKAGLASMIPRSIPSKRQQSKVSSLAKHFEQLSREFEKERLRERRRRAATEHLRTLYPVASSRPIVEVFRDAHEAVKEQDPSGEEVKPAEPNTAQGRHVSADQSVVPTDGDAALQIQADDEPLESQLGSQENLAQDDSLHGESYPTSLQEGPISDTEHLPDETRESSQADDSHPLSPESVSELTMDLPKHEKTSLMKMLTSFWSERSAIGWTPIDYPLLSTNHIFADSDIIVREDEPSSLVAFALASQDYQAKMQKFRERVKAAEDESQAFEGNLHDEDLDVERILLGSTATHMKYQFQASSARMQCKVFFAESFDAIRRKCGAADRFVESLSRCLKWDSKGGKTKSLFLKTLDERFVLKSLSAAETTAFLKFAPDYFDYMSKCLFHNLPSALAKMLGFYQIVIKNPVTGIEFNYFLQVMENVFYEGPSNRMFDLKGSMRNRKIQSTGEKNEVLLDENLLDYISGSPVYVRNHSNSILASSISNDTLFCSKQNVMDYSLIVGLYDDRKELLVGIIDYIRTYTWDKKLESWIKDRGKHKPTVRSPKDYRNRFRASIPRYFPLAPSCWQLFGQQRLEHGQPVWGAAIDPQDVEEPTDENGQVEEPAGNAEVVV